MTDFNRKTIINRREFEIIIDFRNQENLDLFRRFTEVLAINGVDVTDYLLANMENYIETNRRPKTEKSEMLTFSEMLGAIRVEFADYPQIVSYCEKPELWRYWRNSKNLRLRSDYFPVKKKARFDYFYNKKRIFAFLRERYKHLIEKEDEKVDEIEEPDEEKLKAEREWREAMKEKLPSLEGISANPEDYDSF